MFDDQAIGTTRSDLLNGLPLPEEAPKELKENPAAAARVDNELSMGERSSADYENGEPRRGRGRPPGLRTLLLERFPDNATLDQLRGAGYHDPLKEVYLHPPHVEFNEPTGIYSMRRGKRGRPPMSAEQRAAKEQRSANQKAAANRESLLPEAEQINQTLVDSTQPAIGADIIEFKTSDGDAASREGPMNRGKWRQFLKVHPAADMLPAISTKELETLARDIADRGLRHPIVLLYKGDISRRRPKTVLEAIKKYDAELIDGRSRLDAIELIAEELCDDCGDPKDRAADPDFALSWLEDKDIRWEDRGYCDPYAYVVSANIRRRHLTNEQKREVLAALYRDNPNRSDRAIAKMAGVDNKTAAAVRTELEAREEIPHVDKRADTKGRQQPATKPRPAQQPVTYDQPAPELMAPSINQRSIVAGVDLTRSSPAERLAHMPERPDDDDGPASFRVPADPKRMANRILDNVGRQQASEVLEALAALLAPPQTKTLQ